MTLGHAPIRIDCASACWAEDRTDCAEMADMNAHEGDPPPWPLPPTPLPCSCGCHDEFDEGSPDA